MAPPALFYPVVFETGFNNWNETSRDSYLYEESKHFKGKIGHEYRENAKYWHWIRINFMASRP